MSLIISMRIPDGIIVAADSLSTANNIVELIAENISFQCPKCKTKIPSGKIKLPPIPMPFSGSSYTQKLFKLFDRYAVSFFGMGNLNEKSIYYHLKQFELEYNKDDIDLHKLVENIQKYFQNELLKAFPDYKEKAPDNWSPIGFHINGYAKESEGQKGITYELRLGKLLKKGKYDSIGCTVGGKHEIISKLWEMGKTDPRHKIRYGLLTLQDAIELSEFYINTTSTYQKFSNQLPTVGGNVDIALITPFHKFKWVARKKLFERIEEDQ